MDLAAVPPNQLLAGVAAVSNIIQVGLTGIGAKEGRLTQQQVQQIKAQLDSLAPQLDTVHAMVRELVDSQHVTLACLLGLLGVQVQMIEAQRCRDFEVAVCDHDPKGKRRPPQYYPLVTEPHLPKRDGTLFVLNFRVSNRAPRPVTVQDVYVCIEDGARTLTVRTRDRRTFGQLQEANVGTALEEAVGPADYPRVGEGIAVFRIGLSTKRNLGVPPAPLPGTVVFAFLHGDTREVRCEFLCAPVR
ncbi:MAG: hypothetical protein ACLF0G_09030 [Candidatus Brocadiia bacterium]